MGTDRNLTSSTIHKIFGKYDSSEFKLEITYTIEIPEGGSVSNRDIRKMFDIIEMDNKIKLITRFPISTEEIAEQENR